MQSWLRRGLAPATVNHRRTALLHMWNKLDGHAEVSPSTGCSVGRKGGGVTWSAEGERHPTEDGPTDLRWSQGAAAVRRTRMLGKLQFGIDVEFFSAGMRVTRNQGRATLRPAPQFRDGAVRRHRGRPGNKKQLLGHASTRTTGRYTLAAIPGRLRDAITILDDKFAVWRRAAVSRGRNVAVPRGSTDVIEFHPYFYGAGDGDRTRDQRLGKP